ncbi:hypothetical protein SKAU_G00171770 [Synaphobranchus kaupii]|uniref:LINE-1 type transposase domain-containing protein 1 n=1 Tax=Synaphobranchus kaupii TaxID=118154 RepID=A0A9Q1FKI5_SYNKA|nr:hypothetical protein SKAU_G00171770 [Synaphobranchus kaupii]
MEVELVTMDSVRKLMTQMLAQQKAHYVEMLDKQSDTFQKFVRVIMDSTNERLDSMNRSIQELKDSIQYTQRDVEKMKLKADYLENQSRRNNLIFDGIKESARESWADTEGKVRTFISQKLKLDAGAMPIERAHRRGKTDPGGDKQRPIVVKFFNFKDRDLIMKKRQELKKELKKNAPGIYINEDFSEAVRQRRRDLLPKLREAWDRGDIAYLKFDCLVAHPPRVREVVS